MPLHTAVTVTVTGVQQAVLQFAHACQWNQY